MESERKPKKSMEEIIAEANQLVRELKTLVPARGTEANYYRAMEHLLYAYPRRVYLLEHPEEVDFFPTGRSKDISIAPPPGTGVVDRIEAAELYTEARKQAYEYEMRLLYETQCAIAPFLNREEFLVIRLLYFNEDISGHYRGNDAKRLTFAEIVEELERVGIYRSESAIRRWRSALVREMTVMRFGAEGAVSIEMRTKEV